MDSAYLFSTETAWLLLDLSAGNAPWRPSTALPLLPHVQGDIRQSFALSKSCMDTVNECDMIKVVSNNFQVGPLLTRRHYSSAIRPEISVAERLSVGLRFLATGNSQVHNKIVM